MINWIKNNFRKIIGLFFFLGAILLIQQPKSSLKIVGAVLFVGAFYFSNGNMSNFLPTLAFTITVVLYVALALSWWNGASFFGKSIDNDIMLVVTTVLYVVLTYLNITKSQKLFDISRLPLAHIYDEATSIAIENRSIEFKIENAEVEIELVNPIPKTPSEYARYWVKRIFRRFRGDEIKYEIAEIMPNSTEWLDFDDFFVKQLKLKPKDVQGDPNVIPYLSDKEFKFMLNVSVRYETDTGYPTPNDIKATFTFECNKEGCQLIKRESKTKRVY